MKGAKGEILYVGKAANLRRRVLSYFTRAHDMRIERLVRGIRRIAFERTDTALEALIREAQLIKKYAPPFNIRMQDDKSFPRVRITNEPFPRVLVARGKDLAGGRLARVASEFGPFPSASQLREALRIIRRIFPWSDHDPDRVGASARPCFEYEIGLCPGTCIGAVSREEYRRNIRNIKLLFEGKKRRILPRLTSEMKRASRGLEFERAAKLRGQIFALRHIKDTAFVGESEVGGETQKRDFRIEGYDVSNISGTSAVGSMVVFRNGEPDPSQYRRFRIRTVTGSDDTGMLSEVLTRRFAREGWPLPQVILVDGGRGQVNAARKVLRDKGLTVPVVGIAKGPERKRNDFIGRVPEGVSGKTLIKVRDEAHRFAIAYHKKLRASASLQ